MKINKEFIIMFLLFFCAVLTSIAQETEYIDPSKPTNIYTRLNNNFEMTDLKDGTQLTGYRFNVSYALKDFQTTIEIPMLYNHKTQKAGLGDLRIRSFYVPYVDYDKTFGGLGLSLDIFAPMGDPRDGISSGLWSISPGIITGIMVSKKFSIWPIISYRYQFGERWQEGQQQSVTQHGATFQIMNTINISDKVYFIITPMYIQNNFANMGQFDYGGEIEFNYMLIENKLQVGCFSRQLVNSQLESYRLMVRIFL
ncbi:hypothetical protein EI427_19370 [Flammeovirga pectinis]|uniref:Transporter n=1 Tax=Flammeovirga pectinis TaxID=2494373 RepID=A0A3Q9FTJ6_9BACT|nr:hypothetical protein [Flammeovirga pectinis]AZQ64292.1 hypothetical protein EI427_19370 [Flammeovirga pectinis]